MTTQTEIAMSSINEFLDCPLRYRLHHIDGEKPTWQASHTCGYSRKSAKVHRHAQRIISVRNNISVLVALRESFAGLRILCN
ncbi:MAG: hypothetical protein P8184_03710 [Calditrichia bacterium]